MPIKGLLFRYPMKNFRKEKNLQKLLISSLKNIIIRIISTNIYSRKKSSKLGPVLSDSPCRTILGHQFTTYSESITKCNMKRLSDRRVDHCLTFAQGLGDNQRTSHLLPPSRISIHGKNLRNANKLSQPMTKTNRFKQSPIPYFVSLLNM